MRRNGFLLFAVFWAATSLPLPAQAQTPQSAPAATAETTLHVTSRAVLVDVIVTDRKGAPVSGLKREDFTITEQGKPQSITYFEEHNGILPSAVAEIPTLPPNVFSNFSPVGTPPAVNVLLLDSLNTPIADQSYVHTQALKFLQSLRPGTRLAIFTMSMGLRFVQGFTDDPTLLLAAINNKKNLEVAPSDLLKTQGEDTAQQNLIALLSQPQPDGPGQTTTLAPAAMIAALSDFFQETDYAHTSDRELRTLTSLQQLGAYLAAIPGRKNVIWLAGSFPQLYAGNSSQQTLFGATPGTLAGNGLQGSPVTTNVGGDAGVFQTTSRTEDQVIKTLQMLTAARVALYPVDVRGTKVSGFYQSDNILPASDITAQAVMNTHSMTLQNEAGQNASERNSIDEMARESGGKAYVDTNGLLRAMQDVVTSSSDFYTLSYAPANTNMNGLFRAIDVKINGGKYNLSFRRGYFANDSVLPGATPAPTGKSATDPLRPFMDFGLPQTEQILYKALIQPVTVDAQTPPGADQNLHHYTVDFAVDLNDVKLDLQPDGTHQGSLYIAVFVYDKYGQAASRQLKQANLKIKPDIYAIFQKTGLQLRATFDVPKGQYWLRTGIYDAATHKVGTLEIPLSMVKTLETKAD